MDIHNLSDDKLANYLAYHLSDLEFELLVRERIRMRFLHVHTSYPYLGEHHNQCCFRYRQEDASEWTVVIGSTYRDEVQIKGEVLSISLNNAISQYVMQHGNKMSMLLPPPVPAVIIEQTDDDNEMPF